MADGGARCWAAGEAEAEVLVKAPNVRKKLGASSSSTVASPNVALTYFLVSTW